MNHEFSPLHNSILIYHILVFVCIGEVKLITENGELRQ